jgi:tetratricopeptide (TPR) repeat protein
MIPRLATLLVIASCLLRAGETAAIKSSNSGDTPTTDIQQLFAHEQWQQVVELAGASRERSGELNYYYGVALAHLERWQDARLALLAGSHARRDDKRFPVELAGVAFRQKNYPQAVFYLRRALALDPRDAYANDFLATIYFLQGNNEAALKYWNRVGKPEIVDVRVEPQPHVDPVLLDHAFAFSPAGTLHLDDLVATEARLDGLGIFPLQRFDLEARADGKFDAVLHAVERNGWGNSKLESVLRFFRGLSYQEVHPEYDNIGGGAVNLVSLVRWDAQKRRVSVDFSGPGLPGAALFGRDVSNDPKWRYRLGTDLRDENWELRDSFAGAAPVKAAVNLRREELSADVTRLVGGRLRWSLGAGLSHRDYRNVFLGTALTPKLVAKSYELKQSSQIDYELWRVPERRFKVTSGLSLDAARIWSQPRQTFAKLQGSLDVHWFPRARDDDYATRWQIRSGRTFGSVPFDELFMLGLERDNDLPLRAHLGTRDGRKGSAPLGGDYVLSNFESEKNVYSNGFFSLKLGPFVDAGRITGPSAALGSRRWLLDAGIEAKVSVLGVGVVLSYGRDLHTGRGAFYTRAAP